MKLGRWLLVGFLAIAVTAFAVDRYFSNAVFAARDASDRSVLVASEGILAWRRAVHLSCSPAGLARIVTKAHLEWLDSSRLGARSKGGFHLTAWERRGRADIQIDTNITITAVGWFDTLESDPLDSAALEKIAGGLSNAALDFIAVHGFEHGFYFERSRLQDLQPLEPCLPKIRST